MSDYLTAEQHGQLLRDLNPVRVGKDGKGFAHLQAWDCRAHMNRIFGFGRWDEETLEMSLLFDTETEKDGRTRHTVAYKALVRVSVRSANGTPLATYSEYAIGDSTNNPSHADAHDMAVKTAQSQAFKRCLVNLGTQWGLSLYQQGSTKDVVGRTMVGPDGGEVVTSAPVDAHVTTPVAPESSAPPEPRPEQRTTSGASRTVRPGPEKVSGADLQARINEIQALGPRR